MAVSACDDHRTHVKGKRDAARIKAALKWSSRTLNRSAASRAPCDMIGRLDAEMTAEGGRVHDPDVAARRRRRDCRSMLPAVRARR